MLLSGGETPEHVRLHRARPETPFLDEDALVAPSMEWSEDEYALLMAVASGLPVYVRMLREQPDRQTEVLLRALLEVAGDMGSRLKAMC